MSGKNARKGSNPQTGQEMMIKAKKIPKSVPGKALKDAYSLIMIQIGCIVSSHREIRILIGAFKKREGFLVRKEDFHGEYRPCAHSCK